MQLNSKIYEALKWAALIALPALAWFIGQVGPVWGWPYVEQVVLTLNALGTLLGVLLGVSTYNYRKGQGGDNADQ